MGNTVSPLCKEGVCYKKGKFGYTDMGLLQMNKDYIVCEEHKKEGMVQFYCTDCHNIAKYGLISLYNNNPNNEAIYCAEHMKYNGIHQLIRCFEPSCFRLKNGNFNYCTYHMDDAYTHKSDLPRKV
jgi:hypothetical protein